MTVLAQPPSSVAACHLSRRPGRPVTPARPQARVLHAEATKDQDGGTGLLDRPDLDTSREATPQTADGIGTGDLDKNKSMGGGNHRLLLVHAEKHTERGVVGAVTTVVPGVSKDHAANCYHTAKQLGMAMITSCLKEHAEFYAQQLYARGCRTKIEPDTTTL